MISSAMVATVTGAAVANVAITGAFTIPYMKRSGYSAEEAGAIEVSASTGGQLMPPIMGAAAFLMASFMGVPYATIMLAALLPALLYFWGCILSVQLIAVRSGIEAPPEPVDKQMVMRRLPLFLIPLGLLVVAALAAAGISGGDYMRTSLLAFKVAISGFIIPYLVVYNPS